MIDNAQVNHLERIASFHELRYQKLNELEGNIGLITNGAGLTSATIDLIHQLHGKPANRLDFTTASSIEDMLQALDLMEYDERVKVVLINIFGGGLDIHRISEGIVKARQMDVITKPIVVRLRGMFAGECNQMIEDYLATDGAKSKAPTYLVKEMDMAALQAVKIAQESELAYLMEI